MGAAIVAASLIGAVAAACGGDGCPRVSPPQPTGLQSILLDPSAATFRQTSPDTFRVRLETSAGGVVVEVVRDWAPIGADRFYNLARNGFFDGNRFFRVLPGFIVQFGVSGVPAIQAAWNDQNLVDDPVRQSNLRGTLAFAAAGPDTRTTQVFINYADNVRLDALGFAPIGRVVEGMTTLRLLYGEYGETAPDGDGPFFECMLSGGNAYLYRGFERLDSILRVTITP